MRRVRAVSMARRVERNKPLPADGDNTSGAALVNNDRPLASLCATSRARARARRLTRAMLVHDHVHLRPVLASGTVTSAVTALRAGASTVPHLSCLTSHEHQAPADLNAKASPHAPLTGISGGDGIAEV